MRRKGVVFSNMFVLRPMGNELVPSPRVGLPSNTAIPLALFEGSLRIEL